MNTNTYRWWFVLACSLSCMNLLLAQNDGKVRTIVLDAGHGGKDPGCHGRDSKEKHVALAVVKKIGAIIESQMPDVQVIYTRDKDVFIELHRRAAIANEANADLFISIHCNALPNGAQAYGSETYALGVHKLQENLAVANRENEAILLEDNHKEIYDAENYILQSMLQHSFLEQSLMLADFIEKEFKKHRRSRGVRQAGFAVLRLTTMPSVLVETGYLTTPNEEDYLASNSGQQEIAQDIFNALKKYRAAVEGNSNDIAMIDEATAETIIRVSNPPKTEIEKPVPGIKEDSANAKTSLPETPIPVPTVPKSTPTIKISPPSSTVSDLSTLNAIQFCVQLAASPSKIDIQSSKWQQLPFKVSEIQEGGYFKYQGRGYSDFEAANIQCQSARKMSFKDAFIVAYKGNEKITVQDAKDLMVIQNNQVRP